MTLSFAASRFEHGKTSNSPENAHYFLSCSISAVKEDLENPSKQGSDSMIATVASLANLEVCQAMKTVCREFESLI
jgi:hypothetical protein